MSLVNLCRLTKAACDVIAPLVLTLYSSINSDNGTVKLKADKSAFTIADGIVQHLLKDNLFSGDKFLNIVGEEDESHINIATAPYTVDKLIIPEDYYTLIDNTKKSITELSKTLDAVSYRDLTVFIDPIDGTKEFSSGLGEQCSICVGFSNREGFPVAGIVYRPITGPPTWAAGASSEDYHEGSLNYHPSHPLSIHNKGFLTSNGAISPFIQELMHVLEYERVPSGGAGNKMLMLLEGHGNVYIQDRGVSRWDTCGAQAVLEAYGGKLLQLSPFVKDKSLQSYSYLESQYNLDFEPNLSNLTPFNVRERSILDRRKRNEEVGSNMSETEKGVDKRPIVAEDVSEVKIYSNLKGLLALSPYICQQESTIVYDHMFNACQRAQLKYPPAYD